MIKLELAEREVQELIAALDVAVKAGGIKVAVVVSPLVAKIDKAANPSPNGQHKPRRQKKDIAEAQ